MKALNCVSVALLLGGMAMNAHAGCEQPPLVQLPPADAIEGNERQVADDMEAYFLGMQEYVNCIRTELDSAPEDASELYRRVLIQRNNLAVAEAEAVQRWFESRFPDLPAEDDVPAADDEN